MSISTVHSGNPRSRGNGHGSSSSPLAGEITVGIAGAAGDGLDKTGDTLAHTVARQGLHAFAYNSYQSLIRGGHTWLKLRLSEQKRYCHGDHLNVLIALNQDSIERHAREVEPGGIILFNGDKIKCDPSLLQPDVQVIPIPFKELTKDMGRLLPVMQNTISLGAMLYLIGLDVEVMCEILAETFRHKGADVINQNVGVARAGYEFAQKQGQRHTMQLKPGKDRLPFMTGNSAMAFGAAAGGCNFYAAYPMSPASSILDWMTAHSVKCNIAVKQCEDEIAVANMTIGAGHAGARAMCATSGGGFALMTEAIGMAGIIETPAVFINVMRGGPSTGLPTKTEQADLNQALGASQGDFPRVIIAPTTTEDCFYSAVEALNLAEVFQLPVIILSDLLLGEHTETLDLGALRPDVPIERGELVTGPVSGDGGYKRYLLTPSGVSPRALPGTPGTIYTSGTDEHDEEGYLISDEHTNSALRRVMAEKRARKMEGVLAKLPAPRLVGSADADVTLIGWGSSWGAIHEAVGQLEADGIKANHLNVKYMMPFQAKEIALLLSGCKKTVAVEQNQSGQLTKLLRAETGIAVDHLIVKFDGEPLEPGQITAQVTSLVKGQPVSTAVNVDEAREIAYHYIRIHLEDRVRPVNFNEIPANGYGEPLWKIELHTRDTAEPMGSLLVGRTTGATYGLEPSLH